MAYKLFMITVIETKSFIDNAKGLLTDEQRSMAIDFIAEFPDAGEVMPGTGGVRKLRVALQGRGKRGGARVVYYYHNEDVPVFLLFAYAKNVKDDLTKKEQNVLKDTVNRLRATY